MDNLKWIMEYPKRRTLAEQAMRTAMIEEYVAVNNCRYDNFGDQRRPTAQPKVEDKHSFTPTERINLDFEGKF